MKPADAATGPLCATHHQPFHRIGVETFEFRYDVDLRGFAAQLAARRPLRSADRVTMPRTYKGNLPMTALIAIMSKLRD
jgi:hypothetical protein